MNQASYGYLGSAWSGAANNNRKWAQSYGQQAAQNAGQWSQYNVARQQFQNQQNMNQMKQRDSAFRFGIGALAGLMR